MSGSIQLVTVGNVSLSMLREIAKPILATFKLQSLSGTPLTHPKYALNPSRGQFHATAILRRLSSQLAPPQIGILGIGDVDLFTPEAEFVYGEADRESHAAVVSIFRLSPGARPDQLLKRVQAETTHQVGQLLGLSHCDDVHCTMFASKTPADSERKGTALCNDCRNELGRLTKISPT